MKEVQKAQIRKYLGKLDTPKSLIPDVLHPQMLRELADVIMRSLSINFNWSW